MKLRNLRKTEQKEKKKRGIKNQLKAIDEIKSSDERESNLFSLEKIREMSNWRNTLNLIAGILLSTKVGEWLLEIFMHWDKNESSWPPQWLSIFHEVIYLELFYISWVEIDFFQHTILCKQLNNSLEKMPNEVFL